MARSTPKVNSGVYFALRRGNQIGWRHGKGPHQAHHDRGGPCAISRNGAPTHTLHNWLECFEEGCAWQAQKDQAENLEHTNRGNQAPP